MEARVTLLDKVLYSAETEGRSIYGCKIDYMPVDRSVSFVQILSIVLISLLLHISAVNEINHWSNRQLISYYFARKCKSFHSRRSVTT
jgi:hypothetical protein